MLKRIADRAKSSFSLSKMKVSQATERIRRASVQTSLPDFSFARRSETHQRASSLRPLPTIPGPAPPRSHMRRPTGPRALPFANEHVTQAGISIVN